jgi:hypothetical protein
MQVQNMNLKLNMKDINHMSAKEKNENHQGSPHLQKTGRLDFSLKRTWGRSEDLTETSNIFIDTCFCKNVLFLRII